jgi:hypothetical protein
MFSAEEKEKPRSSRGFFAWIRELNYLHSMG